MGKIAKIVPPEKLAIAEENGIPTVTVYKRLQRGWDLEKAITKSTREVHRQRNDAGEFADSGKGQIWRFSMPAEWDSKLEKAIADSGLSQYDFLANVVINKLKRIK
ncbi:hypothetical protein IQ238_18105 [Pleurocapsales cyanobacterium LEGE 06147]|nr:hypothetical protein [Pleurocapsales cyanobacterium LEGE 06147]